MKIRKSFVSNSSSASFILDKRFITPDQIRQIVEYNDKDYNEGGCSDHWSIDEDKNFVRAFTFMDNGYLLEWIKKNLDIPLKAIIEWEDLD